jgi:hypothetical protein
LYYLLSSQTSKTSALMSTAIYDQCSHWLVICTNDNTPIIFVWPNHRAPNKAGVLLVFHLCVVVLGKTTPILTNWDWTLIEISESPNYRSADEDMFREVIKWISHVILGHPAVLWNLDCVSRNKYTCHKTQTCKFRHKY